MTAQQPAAPIDRFEHDAAEAVEAVRRALARWVRGLDGPVTSASELQRATALDMKLCWKVFRVLESPDALSAALFVPGGANLRSLMAWIKRRRGGGEVLADLAEASRRFDEVVSEHAGDRQAFDSMVSPWTRDQRQKLDANHRRAAFRANRHIWGIQGDVHLSTYIMCASRRDPEMLDGALLSCRVGLRRLRQGTTPLFSQLVGVADDDGVIRRPLRGEPLDPENAGDLGLSIVRDFCSENLPHIITQQTTDGYLHATLPLGMTGLKSAVTVVTGHLTPGFAGRYRAEHNLVGLQTVFVQIPLRTLIIDLIVEDGTFGPIAPTGSVYADRTGRLPYAKGDQRVNLLSGDEPVVRLGYGTRVLSTPAVPRYPELVEMAMARLGVEPGRCATHRLRIEYPVMLSRAVISFPLPPRPPDSHPRSEPP